MQLADMGADVVKIEQANGVGDGYRLMGTRMKLPSGEVMGSSFATANRGKRSVKLELKHPSGKAALLRLLASADVFIQNWRPGVAERLGIGYEQIKEQFPQLIYLSISGFGDSGPLSHQPVYDPLIQARSGTVAAQNRLNDPAISATENPGDAQLVNMVLVDKTTAMTGVQAVLAALYAKKAGHVEGVGGQHIKLAMLDTGLAFNWVDLQSAYHYFAGDEHEGKLATGSEDERVSQRIAIQESFGLHNTEDGAVTMLTLLGKQKNWDAFCSGLAPELKDDPRFQTPRDRLATSDCLREVKRVCAKWPTDKIVQVLEAADVPVAGAKSLADSFIDPQVVHQGTIVEHDHPHFGRIRETRPAPVMTATPLRTSGRDSGPYAPLYGEHTQEVLAEAGFTEAQIEAMREEGAFGGVGEQ
eukprot:g1136.t1